METGGIVALFSHLDDVCRAADEMKSLPKFQNHVLYSPTSYHELMDVAEEKWGPSGVRWFTLVGCLSGLITGFGMPLLCDWDWPIVVGGKQPGFYSLPAYVVFGFELMILFGALCTIGGMIILGRLPDTGAKVWHPRITDDRFAIYVPGALLGGDEAKLLESWGAENVFEA